MTTSLTGATLLVTGAGGFIGRQVLVRLRHDSPDRVVALTRGPAPKDEDPVTWLSAGLETLSAATWRKAGVTRFDVVLHLGGHMRRKPGPEEMDPIFRDNLAGTRALLESLPDAGRIVFASTTDVYRSGADDVIDEQSPIEPATLYAASKLFCENLVRHVCSNRGWESSILRYGNTYGPGDGYFTKLVPVLARQVMAGQPPTLIGDGSAERDLIYVSDVAEATVRAAAADAMELGPINVVAGQSYSTLEVARLLLRLLESDLEPELLGAPDSGGHSVRCDNRRMFAELGHWPLVDLETGLAAELAYARSELGV